MTATIEVPLAGDYRIDLGESAVSFTTTHMFGLGRVRGTFRIRDGHIHVADPLRGCSARVTIAAASIDTRNPARDATVRSQYLESDTHPDIVFVSTQLNEAEWVLDGKLMVHGRTRPLRITIHEARPEGRRLHVKASCVVDRFDFGITKMRGMTGRKLRLDLEVVANSSTER
jgi:polyisoprenoid-binding protein YceI